MSNCRPRSSPVGVVRDTRQARCLVLTGRGNSLRSINSLSAVRTSHLRSEETKICLLLKPTLIRSYLSFKSLHTNHKHQTKKKAITNPQTHKASFRLKPFSKRAFRGSKGAAPPCRSRRSEIPIGGAPHRVNLKIVQRTVFKEGQALR